LKCEREFFRIQPGQRRFDLGLVPVLKRIVREKIERALGVVRSRLGSMTRAGGPRDGRNEWRPLDDAGFERGQERERSRRGKTPGRGDTVRFFDLVPVELRKPVNEGPIRRFGVRDPKIGREIDQLQTKRKRGHSRARFSMRKSQEKKVEGVEGFETEAARKRERRAWRASQTRPHDADFFARGFAGRRGHQLHLGVMKQKTEKLAPYVTRGSFQSHSDQRLGASLLFAKSFEKSLEESFEKPIERTLAEMLGYRSLPCVHALTAGTPRSFSR